MSWPVEDQGINIAQNHKKESIFNMEYPMIKAEITIEFFFSRFIFIPCLQD
jgi:hypothetical protein